MRKREQGWWDGDLSPHLEISTSSGVRLDLIVDSGFNGAVTLPLALIKKLRLKKRGHVYNRLADGSVVSMPSFKGEILWFGQRMQVLVQGADAGNEGLLGTELFQGCVVELDLDADHVLFRKKSSRARKRAK